MQNLMATHCSIIILFFFWREMYFKVAPNETYCTNSESGPQWKGVMEVSIGAGCGGEWGTLCRMTETSILDSQTFHVKTNGHVHRHSPIWFFFLITRQHCYLFCKWIISYLYQTYNCDALQKHNSISSQSFIEVAPLVLFKWIHSGYFRDRLCMSIGSTAQRAK